MAEHEGGAPPPGHGQPPPGYGYGVPGPGGPYGWVPPPGYGYPPPPSQTTSEKAVIVLVTGAASIPVLFTCLLGIVPAIVALCLAPGAKREIAQSRGALGGGALITGGVICAWITIGLTIIAVITLVLLFAFATSWTIGDTIRFRG